jgi:hypothetical protein
MTNPNLVNVGMVRMQNEVSSTLTTSYKAFLYNPASSNQVLRLDSFVATNTSNTAVTIDAGLVRSTVGYAFAKEIEIPAYSTMVLMDKDYPLYIEETDSIRARVSTANAVHVSINFTEIGESVSTNIYGLSENYHPASLDIFAWSGTGASSATITRDTGTGKSPFGGDPMKMAVTGNDPYIGTYNSSTWNIAPAAVGQTWEVRVWAKASTATTGEIFIFGVDSGGSFIANAGAAFGAGGVSIGTDWSEVSYSFTFSDAGVAFVQTRVDGTPTGGTGIDIWWDNLQVYRIS